MKRRGGRLAWGCAGSIWAVRACGLACVVDGMLQVDLGGGGGGFGIWSEEGIRVGRER